MTTKLSAAPDDTFALRYRRSYRYGFYVRLNDNEVEPSLDRFIALDLNPQQITMREPIATSITYTQGGGKYIESRGSLIKNFSVTGTTGYTPLPQGQLNPSNQTHTSAAATDSEKDTILSQRSGFYAFYKLRHLFRLYMHERRKGNTDITMHWFDQKGNDYWRIEPQEFAMLRSSRKPYSYDYQISFQGIEETDTPAESSKTGKVAPEHDLNQLVGAASVSGLTGEAYSIVPNRTGITAINNRVDSSAAMKKSVNRIKTQRLGALAYLRHLSGVVKTTFQNTLRQVNDVVGFFEDVHSTFTTLLDLPLTLLKQLDNSLTGLINTAFLFAPDNIAREVNEWVLECKGLIMHMGSQLSDAYDAARVAFRLDAAFSQGRLKSGASTDLLTEPDGSVGSPDVNPFLGISGLSLVTDLDALAQVRSTKSFVILDGETIYTVAQRLLGSTNRFIDLIVLNNLSYPYIVSSDAEKPTNTLAWGEYINIPATSLDSPVGEELLTPQSALSGSVSRTSIPTELVDENVTTPWRENQWVGYTVTLTHGANSYTRVVVGNTADTLTVNTAWSPSPAEKDTYVLKLVLFDIHRPVTPEAKAYGKDILLAFTPNGSTNVSQMADIVLGASKDLAVVRGLENFFQAITLRMNTEMNRHPFHPDFGVPLPVGKPWNEDIALLYTYFVRQSLLRDPRVESMRDAQLTMESGTISFSADVQPIHVRQSRQLTVALT